MTSPGGTLNRDILRLAVPALGALIAEPLFLIVDSALVGHLGVAPLAGLGIASAILQTIVGLMVFLAYSTTPAVARRFGAGDLTKAVSVGIDGLWLALAIGAGLALVGYLATPFLVGLFGATPDVTAEAVTYLGISMWGLPAMLIVFAATGTPPRHAGHRHAAVDRRARIRRERAPQLAPHLRPGLGHRRLGGGDGGRPSGAWWPRTSS